MCGTDTDSLFKTNCRDSQKHPPIIQGHEAFENAQGHGGWHCPSLPQAISTKNKGVLRVGVPLMQDLQEWAEQSQSSKDYKLLTLETFEAAL